VPDDVDHRRAVPDATKQSPGSIVIGCLIFLSWYRATGESSSRFLLGSDW
jgi:hypothetical protein